MATSLLTTARLGDGHAKGRKRPLSPTAILWRGVRHSRLKIGGHGPPVLLGQCSFERWHLGIEGFPALRDAPINIGVSFVLRRVSQPFQIGWCRHKKKPFGPSALSAPPVASGAVLIEHSRTTPQLCRRIRKRVAERAVWSGNATQNDCLMPRHICHPARSVHVGLSSSNGE